MVDRQEIPGNGHGILLAPSAGQSYGHPIKALGGASDLRQLGLGGYFRQGGEARQFGQQIAGNRLWVLGGDDEPRAAIESPSKFGAPGGRPGAGWFAVNPLA